MAIKKIHIIPDYSNIEETMTISQKWNTAFEYNDFFIPALLDDEESLKARISFYKNLDRDRSSDTLHGVFFDICVNSCDPKIKRISEQRMRSSMETALLLGCRSVIFHTNLIPGFETKVYLDSWCEKNAGFYRTLCGEYPTLNVLVENMFEYSPMMLSRLAKSMKDVDNFGVCYDVAHGNLHDTNMDEWFEALSPYIKHLHINDNDGKTDLHNAVGAGITDWDKYFELINQYGIDAGMLIEVSKIADIKESLSFLTDRGYLEEYK